MTWMHAICRKRPSDYAGSLFFTGLAAFTIVRIPEIGLLLLPTLAHEVFVAGAFLIRDQPRAAVGTLPARVAAYAGTFSMMAFLHAIRTWSPASLTFNELPQVAAAGALLWLGGCAFTIAPIWSLRFSFSIEPQARRLVQTGPYKYLRHPVYAGYVLHYIGIYLIYPSLILAASVVLWFAMTAIRMRFEEGVLSRAFPEYEEYKRRTGALLPRAGFLLRPRAAASELPRLRTSERVI